jgi:hypothetical protein
VYDKEMLVKNGDIFIVHNAHLEKFKQSIGINFSDVGNSINILKNEESILMIPDQKMIIKILLDKLKTNYDECDLLRDKIKQYKLRTVLKNL